MKTNDHTHQPAGQVSELSSEEQALLKSLDRLGASDRDTLSAEELDAMASASWTASAPKRSTLRLIASVAAVCTAGLATWITVGPSQISQAPVLDEDRLVQADPELESATGDGVITTVAFGDDFAAELEAFDAELGEFELFGLPGDEFTLEGSL